MVRRQCPACRKSSFHKIGRDSEVLPSLPGERWEPVLKNYVLFKCDHCGRVMREEVLLSLPINLDISPRGWTTIFGAIIAVLGLALLFGSAFARTNPGLLMALGVICVGLGALTILGKLSGT